LKHLREDFSLKESDCLKNKIGAGGKGHAPPFWENLEKLDI
jgi:hypothetical protein